MSGPEHPSAVDALVDAEMGLRDQVEQLADERDDATRQAADLAASVDERAEQWWDAGDGATDEKSSAGADGDLEAVRAERDAFLADSQRLAADFANYRKQSDRRVAEAAAPQWAALVRDLLPVLDACDSALEQDVGSAVGPIRAALLTELDKNGLTLIAPAPSEAFDPEQHDVVQHEPADPDAASDDDVSGPAIAELLRAGYAWKGRVIRPAMVKVVG